MINFLSHNEIDKEKWNRCIKDSALPSIFANFEMLSLASSQWCALVEDDYRRVMPLVVRKKWGIPYICTPVFFSSGGVFSSTPVTAEKVTQFIQQIPRKFWRADLLLNGNCSISSDSSLRTYQLSLKDSYCEIAKNYSDNCKRNIKKAYKQSLFYQEEGDLASIITLFRKNRVEAKMLKQFDYESLLKYASFCFNQKWLTLCSVYNNDNTLLAGAFMLHDFQYIRFWFSGRDNTYANANAMFFLIDNYLKNHAESNSIFDFNGSMNQNIARFYKGFGAQEMRIPYVSIRNFNRNI